MWTSCFIIQIWTWHTHQSPSPAPVLCLRGHCLPFSKMSLICSTKACAGWAARGRGFHPTSALEDFPVLPFFSCCTRRRRPVVFLIHTLSRFNNMAWTQRKVCLSEMSPLFLDLVQELTHQNCLRKKNNAVFFLMQDYFFFTGTSTTFVHTSTRSLHIPQKILLSFRYSSWFSSLD